MMHVLSNNPSMPIFKCYIELTYTNVLVTVITSFSVTTLDNFSVDLNLDEFYHLVSGLYMGPSNGKPARENFITA